MNKICRRYQDSEKGRIARFKGFNKRRFRETKVPCDYTNDYIVKMLDFFNNNCPYCGKNMGNNYHIDHIIPFSKGGTNTKDNVLPVCKKCNRQKFTKPLGEFLIILEENKWPSQVVS